MEAVAPNGRSYIFIGTSQPVEVYNFDLNKASPLLSLHTRLNFKALTVRIQTAIVLLTNSSQTQTQKQITKNQQFKNMAQHLC